jgi:hypothetical protein
MARMYKDSTILELAQRLITPMERWTKYEHARKSNGDWCGVTDPDARAWCAWGAIRKYAVSDVHTELLEQVIMRGHVRRLSTINDGPRGHSRVLRLLDKAIARLEKEGR